MKRKNTNTISPPPLRRRKLPSSPQDLPNSDNGSSGELLPQITPKLRIFSWNVNGILPFIVPLKVQSQPSITLFFAESSTSPKSRPRDPESPLRKFLRRHDFPHIICLQEVQIKSDDEASMRALERAANHDAGSDLDPEALPGSRQSSPEPRNGTEISASYKAFFSLPREKIYARRKIYGVATLIRTDLLATCFLSTLPVSWDAEGRVLITKICVRDKNEQNNSCSSQTGPKIALINGYWPNGTESPWRESCESNVEIRGTRHDAKRAFHKLMLEECLRLKDSGQQVILIGDMNIALDKVDGWPGIRGGEHEINRKDFKLKFLHQETQLDIKFGEETVSHGDGFSGIDAFRHLHGLERKYTYYGRNIEWGTSCDRVDLFILSQDMTHEYRKQKERKISSEGSQSEGYVVVECDILDNPLDRGHSDHVPLYVVLALK